MFKALKISFIIVLTSLYANLACAEKRVALVIGNSQYQDATPLKNPQNDASDIAEALRRLDFSVVFGLDLDFASMRKTLKEFSQALEGADIALFYYAGHALQVRGENYLAPVDTVLSREDDLPFETFTLHRIQSVMERNSKTLLLFLDSCRDNPLSRRFSKAGRSLGSTRGMARPAGAAEGTLIAFSTQPGNVALDGDGRNSPFTQALLKNIEKPGLEISSLMTNVRREVYASTNKEQLPWTNSSLLGEFYFSLQDPEEAIGGNEQTLQQRNAYERFENERKAWELIAEEKSPEKIRAFLEEFPDGSYSALAKTVLQQIENLASRKSEQAIAIPENSIVKPSEPVNSENKNDSERPVVNVADVQNQLNRLGCEAGPADGLWGSKSKRALLNFGKHANIELASTDPSHDILESLMKHEGRICPLVCGARYDIVGDQCRLKTCPSGQKLSSKGACYTPRTSTKTASRKKSSSSSTSTRKTTSSSGNCFKFNGQTVCE